MSDAILNAVRNLSVGRISYIVIAAILLALLFHPMLYPGQTKHDRFGDYLVTWLVLLFDVPMILVGSVTLFRKKTSDEPLLFWSIALLFAALPILLQLVGLVLFDFAGIPFYPFS